MQWNNKYIPQEHLYDWNLSIKICHVCMHVAAATAAKSLQSCLTLCDPIDSSPPGSPVPGIFQARTLEWVAISFSNAWKWKVKVKLLSRVWLLATPCTAAYQAPPSMGFSRHKYWSGVPLPSPHACYIPLVVSSPETLWTIVQMIKIHHTPSNLWFLSASSPFVKTGILFHGITINIKIF